jgi:AcrR family transcriptional regulator
MVRRGRPPLSQRRREQTRLEVAEVAVRLFGIQGVTATSAEEIADEVGMSSRTLWRYFSCKEECVRPLLTVGTDAMAERLRRWPPGTPLIPTEPSADWLALHTDHLVALRTIIRLTRSEPALCAVWLRAHNDAEGQYAAALANRDGCDSIDIERRVQAAVINAALRVAAEEWAWQEAESDETDESILLELQRTMRDTLRVALVKLPEAQPGS